ncbi:uncharacterized protein SEPMUDRAFT_50688, partial [Sphaerulina musiva SO2202]
LPRLINCLCCQRAFTTFPGMIIHLESGTCQSGEDVDSINLLAAHCFQWKKYMHKGCRESFIARDKTYIEWTGAKPFKCPTCDHQFALLSSLLQHVWSSACAQGKRGGAIGKLIRWLSKRTYRYRTGW